MRFITRFAALTAAVLLAASPAHARRVALVAGAGAYASAPDLPNAVRDAEAIRDALYRLDFARSDVIYLPNPTRAQFNDALLRFTRMAGGAEAAVIYFSGHGITLNSPSLIGSARSRLLPTNAIMDDAGLAEQSTVALSSLETAVRGAQKLQLVILDACRNLPFAAQMRPPPGVRLRAATVATRGLGPVSATGQIAVWYAAREGTYASDGAGLHSPFTRALLTHLETPGLEISQVFLRVSAAVRAATGYHGQTPAQHDTRTQEFYFKRRAPTPASTGPSCAHVDAPAGQECYISGGRVRFRRVAAAAPVDPCAGQTMAGFECRNVNGQARFFGFVAPPRLRPPIPTPQLPTPAASSTVSAAELNQQGMAAYNRQDYAAALRLFRQAADRGEAAAMNYIGYLYRHGHGVAQDYTEALRWYRQAADRGDAAAMNNIGYLYQHGHGVAQDYAEAMRWYRQAADRGNAGAMYNIGALYQHGHGVAQDYAEALRWYRQAADQGNAAAMNNIAVMYALGEGVAQNNITAAQWFMRALRGGSEETRNILINQAQAPLTRALQRQLRDAGVYRGPINGQMDSATRAAINAIFGKGE